MPTFSFSLNGEMVAVDQSQSGDIFLDWLRAREGLRGSKEGCAEGDCGACSVLLSPPNGGPPRPVNACMLTVGQVAGREAITVEGLGQPSNPHPLQKAIALTGGTQCGYCTPGFVVAGAALLDREERPDDSAIHDALAGNLCRCTGYRPIVEAIRDAAVKPGQLPHAAVASATGDLGEIVAPATLQEAITEAEARPGARYIAGGTDLILERRKQRGESAPLVSLAYVSEITGVASEDGWLKLGGACPIEDLLAPVYDRWPHFGQVLRRFGSAQIRSQATLGGNLATCSPVGDSAPCLIALDARLRLAGPNGERSMPVEEFVVGYRKSRLLPGEIVAEILIPENSTPDFRAWKVSKRYDQDIASLTAAFRIDRGAGGKIVSACAAFGGMTDHAQRCPPVEAALAEGDFEGAAESVHTYFQPGVNMRVSPAPFRGGAPYRSLAAAGLVRRLAVDLGETGIVEVAQL